MIFDMPFDYIAYQPLQKTPYPQTKSGARVEDNAIYKTKLQSLKNPILKLDDDIIYADGTGLKKGFYEVQLSSDYDFLYLIQSNKILAKIPAVKIENINKKSNEKNQKPKTLKQTKKEQKKYKKGENPDDFIHSDAKLKYMKNLNAYIMIYELQNTRAIGIIKL